MDLLTSLAINVVLNLIANRTNAKKAYPALAKVYVKIELLAKLDQNLDLEIQRQRTKEGF